MKKTATLVIGVLALLFIVSIPSAAKNVNEVLYWETEEALLKGNWEAPEFVWPLNWYQGGVSVARAGNRIAFWTLNSVEDTWKITVVELNAQQAYETDVEGTAFLSPDGMQMVVLEYQYHTVVSDGVDRLMGIYESAIYDISDPQNPLKLDTLPALSAEENVQATSWGSDGCLYASVADDYISDYSPDYWGGIIKYDPQTKKRSWVLYRPFSFFRWPVVSWNQKKIVYNCDWLDGEPIYNSLYVRNLRAKKSSLGRFISNDFGYAFGNNLYLEKYEDMGRYYEEYIVKLNLNTGEEEFMAWGWNPQLAVR